MIEVLQCLKKYGQRLDLEIAREMGVPLSTVRQRLIGLAASGEVVMCSLTRFDDGKRIDAWQCGVSGYVPPPAPGRKAKAKISALLAASPLSIVVATGDRPCRAGCPSGRDVRRRFGGKLKQTVAPGWPRYLPVMLDFLHLHSDSLANVYLSPGGKPTWPSCCFDPPIRTDKCV